MKNAEEEKICPRCSSRETTERDNDNKEQWKKAVRRIDLFAFFLFMLIFTLLLIIMVYPYDTSVSVTNNKDCPL